MINLSNQKKVGIKATKEHSHMRAKNNSMDHIIQNKPNKEFKISFSVRTRKGKSKTSDKINQDSCITHMNFKNKKRTHLFGVYDGHGNNGHLVSSFVSKFFYAKN